MKYIVTKTDIFLKGKVYQEGSTIDSKNFTEEDLESVEHLLVPVEKTSNVVVTLAPEETVKSESPAAPAKENIKSPRKPKS